MSRIHPNIQQQLNSDGGTRVEAVPLALDLQARFAEIDRSKLCADRLKKLRAELIRRDYVGALLFDPINIRYATGTRNMALWTLHAPGRYVFVAATGPVVLFEFGSTLHVSQGYPTIDEVRPSIPWFYFMAGPRVSEKTKSWASDITDLIATFGGSERRLAVDRCDPWGARVLLDAGIELFDAQEVLEQARMIKTHEELQCIQLSIDVADVAIERLRAAVRPGITENQLWSILHETNIAHGGEWIECRLLTSGERTNPWFQECSDRVLQPGDMVCFDTDMVGPGGYLADISRSFVCPGAPATSEQRQLYKLAEEQIATNTELVKPGISFREFAERCWTVPPKYLQNRYMMMIHGAGMVDEYPSVVFAADWSCWGYDDVFRENMVLCIESFIGETGRKEGVKLEQQVLVTRSGAVALSKTPIAGALEIK